MNSDYKFTIFIIFVIAGVGLTAPAFGDHATAEISIPQGTSVPGCETTNECFLPPLAQIDLGGEATWSNDDSAAHTVTSGLAANGADGKFDSGLFMVGQTFSVKFDDYEPGEYAYFCSVHPWMTGVIVVLGDESEEEEHDEHEDASIIGVSSNGETMVNIWPTVPNKDQQMGIHMEITDTNGEKLVHVNYDIMVIQNGEVVLDDIGSHFHNGKGELTTSTLNSDDPVDIEITLQGLGDVPLEERTGSIGDKIVFSSVIPEFGTLAMIILGVSIFTIVAFTARAKAIVKI